MNSFVISARKYRPQLFSQIKGQEHITTTLQNALKNHQLAQVFLFCGPKGTGKTTCARVLAKAINCHELGDEMEPCNICPSCKSIQQNQSLAIHELDAASNNSVEDIRNLVAQVRYRPPSGRKIFIIDEAHMLSNSAFHGLLKTLEEPPRHVVFIFATTEKHKVIDTILSRCQIFNFHNLDTGQIINQLQDIAKKEGVTCEQEALQLIGHKAEGSLRDALSTLDLVINFEGNRKLTYKATLQHLNLLDHTYYFELTYALFKGQTSQALLMYDTITRTSFRGDHFIIGLGEHLRNILTSQMENGITLINPAINNQEAYRKQASEVNRSFLYHALQMAHNYGLSYKNIQNKRLHVEVMLIQIANRNEEDSGQAISSKTTQIKDRKPKASPPQNKPTIPIIDATNNKSKAIVQPSTKQPNTGLTTNSKNATGSKKINILLTKQSVLPHWESYAKKLEKEDPSGFSIMQLPIKVDKNSITIMLVNPSQQDKIDRLKPCLINYIAKALDNKNLVIKTARQKKENQPRTQTQIEKFKNLIQKDKNVAWLQKKLDLEVI